MIVEIIYWTSALIIVHSYIIYPVVLWVLSINKPDNTPAYTATEQLPHISILMSLYNEETVITEKIKSIYASDYPADKFEVIVGSDASTDRTNEIVAQLVTEFKTLRFTAFITRQGKGNIINHIKEQSTGSILIITDANVIFDTKTLNELSRSFKNPKIGLVDTNMINKGISADGISIQESSYISREVMIKNRESRIWGTMMGPFGGCYAIRRELYKPVPSTFLVDDFYINMKVFEQGKKAINNLRAKVFEDVSNNLRDEFRRKVRIATGNFQNLCEFRKLLWSPIRGLSFCLISHKVMRWFVPFILIIAFLCNVLLISKLLYLYLFAAYVFTIAIPAIDYGLRKLQINIVILRFITHFYSINIALLIGFYKFMKGVKTNVWQPTKRNQAHESGI